MADRPPMDPDTLERVARWLREGDLPMGPRSDTRTIPCEHGALGWESCDDCTVQSIIEELEREAVRIRALPCECGAMREGRHALGCPALADEAGVPEPPARYDDEGRAVWKRPRYNVPTTLPEPK